MFFFASPKKEPKNASPDFIRSEKIFSWTDLRKVTNSSRKGQNSNASAFPKSEANQKFSFLTFKNQDGGCYENQLNLKTPTDCGEL